MADLNKVMLIGRLTRDPVQSQTSTGAVCCQFGIAINRKFTSQGEAREEVCFVDIETWGKQAESCKQYLSTGGQVFVEGRLKFGQWEDRETGRKRTRLLVVAERVQFLDRMTTNADS